MAQEVLTREALVATLHDLFRRRAYDGVSMAEISAATGLPRTSLYHWFPGGKREMAAAVLAAEIEELRRELGRAASGKGSLQLRLERVLAVIDQLYDGGRKPCIMERLCASSAREPLRPGLGAAFEAWIEVLEALQRSAGADPRTARERAEDAVVRIEGALILCGVRDDTAPFRRVMAELRRTFFAP